MKGVLLNAPYYILLELLVTDERIDTMIFYMNVESREQGN
jgi:hypothetical protein